MVGTIGFEPTTSTVSICLSSFYDLLPCYLILFLSIYYQCVIRLSIISCFIFFSPVFGYYGSKMVATKQPITLRYS